MPEQRRLNWHHSSSGLQKLVEMVFGNQKMRLCTNSRFSSIVLWLLAGLGALTLRESYLTLYGEPPYKAPILKPSPLEFTVTAKEREDAFANATSAAIDNTTSNDNALLPPDLQFSLSSDEVDAAQTANTIDEPRTTLSKNNGKNDNSHTLPWCSRDQLRNGTWVVDRRDKPLYVTPTQHLRCFPSETYSESPYKTWKWLPNDQKKRRCDYQPWSQDDFCRLLPRATVAIIGDSLSWEHYSSLVQTHGLKIHQGFQHQSKELYTNIVKSACNGQTKLLYRRDDRLLNVTAAIEQHFPTVLVLNRGAHFATDAILLKEIQHNIREVRDWLAQCDARNIKCHFFWRTSVPGHPHCGNFTAPINSLRQMEAHVTDLNNYDEFTLAYHWYDFQRQNRLVERAFRQAQLNSFQIIDAYYINMLRPDEHRSHQGDCLHNCYPGKMDVYNDLVLHYLRMQRTDIDVARLVQVANQYGWSVNENTKYDVEATEEAKFFRTGHRDYERLFRERPNEDDP